MTGVSGPITLRSKAKSMRFWITFRRDFMENCTITECIGISRFNFRTRLFKSLYIPFRILSVLQHFHAPINSLIHNTIILFWRFYTGFFFGLFFSNHSYFPSFSSLVYLKLYWYFKGNYVLVINGSLRVNKICVMSHVEINAHWALLVFSLILAK